MIPPAALQQPDCYNSQASTHRADPNISDQATPEASTTVNIATDLARLRDEGRTLTTQELKELTTRIKALEDMAKLEDRLRALENRKRPRSADTNRHTDQQSDQQSSQHTK